VRAQTAAKVAEQARTRAAAKPADLSRVRGEYGSLGSLRQRWGFHILDRAEIDLEVLRPYLSGDCIDHAISAAIAAGIREIRGVEIKEGRHVVVR
jgi:hypothetical protein